MNYIVKKPYPGIGYIKGDILIPIAETHGITFYAKDEENAPVIKGEILKNKNYFEPYEG